jgi:predicted metal-dependent hydrolase
MDRRTRRELIERLNRDGAVIAQYFELRYRVIEAERANVKRRYGVCFSDGTIRIRLNHVVTKEPLRYSSLVDTLCHELAHLRHFNHGVQFQRFHRMLLAFARERSIYQPRPRVGQRPTLPPRARVAQAPKEAPAPKAQGPEQLSLFG